MKRVKSNQEMDDLIAIHEVSCSFVKLNYGLMLSHKSRIGEDGNPATKPVSEFTEIQIQGGWLNPGCTLMKTFISVGSFLNPN